MIEIDKTPRFKTADGQLFHTLKESQIHAVAVIINGIADVAGEIVNRADDVIAILKMKPRKQRTAKPKNKPAAKPVAK